MTDQLAFFQPIGVRRSGAAMDAAFARQVIEVPTTEIRGMVRAADPLESQHAAVQVRGKTTTIQAQILHALVIDGPMTAGRLEQRTEFRGLAPSTVRKRCSELKQAGKIAPATDSVGAPLREDGMAVWRIA